jgi:hypothetical protein
MWWTRLSLLFPTAYLMAGGVGMMAAPLHARRGERVSYAQAGGWFRSRDRRKPTE